MANGSELNSRRGMRYLHHGCILVNSNLDVLSQALNVDPAKYKSKGVASVRSRVGNLAEYLAVHSPDLPPLTVQRVRDAIMEHRSGDEYRMNAADFVAITRLRDAKYSTWDWTYGASPPFTEHLYCTVCGGVTDAEVDGKQVMELVKNQKGRVQDCAVVLLGVCEECCRRQDAEAAAAKQA